MKCDLCQEVDVLTLHNSKPVCSSCHEMLYRLAKIWRTLSPEAKLMLQDVQAHFKGAAKAAAGGL